MQKGIKSQKMTLFFAIGFSLLLGAQAYSESSVPERYVQESPIEISSFSASPASVFTKESTAVTFKAALKNALPEDTSLALVEVDDESQVIRYIGILSDTGSAGDGQIGDSVFSRKIHLNEKIGGFRKYAVLPENSEGLIRNPAEPITSIEVIQRPTFIEVMTQVWTKLKSAF